MPKLGVDWAKLQACWEEIRDSGFFTEGKYVRLFEEEVQRWSGLHAIAFNSAGTGLYSMLRMKDRSSQATAIPNNTFFATGAMAREAGHQIVLVDCNTEDFSMSWEALRAIRQGLGTVVLTHVGGGLAKDYGYMAGWCEEQGITFFEDAAHAMGVGGEGTCAGTHSDGAVFSMYPTKAFPAGDGGVVVTKHGGFAEQLREFRNYGKYRDGENVLRHRRSGFNFRMDEWTAAICYLQMKRRGEIMELRQEAADKLSRLIEPIVTFGMPGESNWYKYPVYADEARALGITRMTGKVYQRSDQLTEAMGITLQGPFPNSLWVADNHVCLPLDEGMYDGMDDSAVLAWLRGA